MVLEPEPRLFNENLKPMINTTQSRLMKVLLLSSAIIPTVALRAQESVPVDYTKYPDYKTPLMTAEDSVYAHTILNRLKSKRVKSRESRPSHWNNANTKHFPAVFNQDGGSCGSASRIGYMFTHEINSLRDADAAQDENVYPTHFTWLLTNQRSSKENMARDNGVPNSIVYGGKTYSRLFGYQEEIYPDYGWMQGYDKWYSAMSNRISGTRNTLSLQTEEGRELLKNWLWNHFGDDDFSSGGVAGIGVASACTQESIHGTEANKAAGVSGLKYIKTWGKQVDHALTIVGYDDRIEFDLNGNGIYGEENADERGAWIIVNSWGNGWANQGFIYCPYKHARVNTNEDGTWGGWYSPELYYARKDYRPLRTLKIKMDYSHRSEICLSAGVSENLNADKPEKSILFEHFRNAGDADADPADAATPMLGKWLTGMNYEPMEFGYDLTDLSSKLNTRKPLKYFFIIETKASAMGSGKVYSCSLMDYEFDLQGIETPFELGQEGMEIVSAGNRTIITMVVPGEPIHAPRNLSSKEQNGTQQLSWSTPIATPYELSGYNVYQNGSLLKRLDATQTEYLLEEPVFTNYAITALYTRESKEYESAKSNEISISPILENNLVRTFSESGFVIPNVLSELRTELTFEFWTKPDNIINWNYHIGPGWGSFLFHASAENNLVAGWSTGEERTNTSSQSFVTGKWQHVAVVVKGSTIKIYINGVEKATKTSSRNSGLGGFGSFTIGRNGREGIAGAMEEFRIWDEARTPEQLSAYMNIPIRMPEAESRLLAYYPMDVIEIDGEVKLRDAKNANHASFLNPNHSEQINNTLLEEGDFKVDFNTPSEIVYVGQEIKLTNNSTPGAQCYRWLLPNATEKELTVANPIVCFTEAGEFDVTLEAYGANDKKREMTKQIVVSPLAVPKAIFQITSTRVSVGERISFINNSEATNASYKWSMPGAEQETATTANAAASYLKEGTYEVTLEVINKAGKDQITHQIVVDKRMPEAAFEVQPGIVLKDMPFTLTDQSKYSPDKWVWTLESGTKIFEVNGQTPTVKITSPGKYKVKLEAQNEKGTSTLEYENALIVCNADAKQALNFDGKDDQVKFVGPFKSAAPTSFTIEWWMNARKNSTYSHKMGDSESTVLLKTNINGEMTLSMSNKSVSSGSGFVKEREWAHYAVVYNNKTVTFYRNGGVIGAAKTLDVLPVAWTGGFVLGGDLYPLAAQIDEFRIWSQPRTLAQIRETANAPLKDIAAAKSAGLLVYYQFNQSSDDVVDLSGNGYTGIRSNFGPDGDAWGIGQGVFSLDLDDNKDITSTYLKNVTRPFRYIPGSFIKGTARFQTLETETEMSPWIMENSVATAGGTTCFHVDANKGNSLTVTSGWDGFANLVNHKLYQTIDLEPGAYILKVTPFNEFSSGGSFLAVAAGKGLPDTPNLEDEVFASAPLGDKTVSFTLTEPTTVSLGMLINMSGNNCITFNSVELYKKTFVNLDNITGVDSNQMEDECGGIRIVTSKDGLTIYSAKSDRIQIYTISGMKLIDEKIVGEKTYQLSKGCYIVNKQKVIIH